jgi:peptide/nickel transport system substrate-binding protein
VNRLKTIFLALSRKERIAFISAAVVFAVSIVVLAGRFIYNNSNLVPTRGGDYVEGFVGQPAYVNPIVATGDVDRSLTRLLFANLTSLTDSIETSKDGKTWSVRLKPNLLWSDGNKLTSDDVMFTIARIQDSETQSPLASAWQGISALRVSELEVQISLAAPYAFFGDTLAALYPIPKHIFVNIPVSNWRLSDFNLKPVGSGAYMFDSYEKQANGFISQYQMKPNEKYSNAGAFIERVRFDFFNDGGALLTAFNTGAVDGITSPDISTLSEVKRSYNTDSWSIPSYYAIFFNQSQNIPLKDAAVRSALGLTIDRDGLIKAVFDGNALPAYGPVPPGSGKSTASSSPMSKDAAIAALDAAGWKVSTSSQVRERTTKDGTVRLAITLTVPQIPFLTKTADMIRSAWQAIGVEVTVSPLPTGATMTETIKNRDYQALLFGNVLGPSFDLYPFWHSKERFAPGLNLSLYSNKKVDTLTETMEHEADPAARARELTEAEGLIVSDTPAIFLYSPYYLSLISKEIRGVEPHLVTEPADRFLDLGKWYIKTTRATAK